VSLALLLAGCGGGGGDSTGVAPPPPPPAAVMFSNVSVHDPAVIKVADTWYVFGSHLAAARSTDLMHWTAIADGVNAGNPLFNNVLTQLADAFTWSTVQDLWAPDVVKLGDGRYRMYYDSCQGSSPLSALGVAVADTVTGPYVNQQILLRSGMNGTSEDGTPYDAWVHPNVVDPNTFLDATGSLWMVYGSYSGGIFIMAMDAAAGLPLPGQGYGKHLMGGNHARIEGAYVFYAPETGYYYLYTSFGGLASDGGYNIRVARASAPDGPYYDAAGTDMATVMGDPGRQVLFDDPLYAPHGQKLLGNYQYALAAGESGAAVGYVSPGHNSVIREAATGQTFIVFHTRFPGQGEVHELRVHELFYNEDGWPVMAPLRYAPLSLSPTPLAAGVAGSDVPGSYKYIDHGKAISASIVASQSITLDAAGNVSGAVTGTWAYHGNNHVGIVLAGGASYNGVLSRQWNPNSGNFEVTFSAQSQAGVSLWGVRSGN
jgi:arabinan endo-1,5-alpha-L-arabinosidase